MKKKLVTAIAIAALVWGTLAGPAEARPYPGGAPSCSRPHRPCRPPSIGTPLCVINVHGHPVIVPCHR